jgi:hypothetical protein
MDYCGCARRSRRCTTSSRTSHLWHPSHRSRCPSRTWRKKHLQGAVAPFPTPSFLCARCTDSHRFQGHTRHRSPRIRQLRDDDESLGFATMLKASANKPAAPRHGGATTGWNPYGGVCEHRSRRCAGSLALMDFGLSSISRFSPFN